MRKIFTLLILLLLLPVTALAAGEDAPGTLWVGQTQITANGYWKTNGDGTLTTDGASESDYNVKYDKDSNTLTLKDATINGTDITGHLGAGIHAGGDLTIVLEGSSTVTGVVCNDESQSIRVSGNLTIQGGGSLTAQGADTSGGGSCSDGILVFGSFTQQGGSVTATAGNVNGNNPSSGLNVSGTVTVKGGMLTATGGSAGNNISYGISAYSSVTVSDATVTAISGSAGYASYGLYIGSSSPSVTLSGSSSLTARSGSATDKAGGIYIQNIYNNSGGSVTVGDNSTLLTNSVIFRDSYFNENPLAPTGDGSWLIYGQSGQPSAVGGTYTLTDDLTIENGNTFTIPAGSTLTVPQGKTLTVNGTLNIANQSSLAGEGTLEAGENSTFNLTNPEPVISGSETLTYDGTDQSDKFTLTALTGTVEVMGQSFTISSSATTDGWSLDKLEIKDAGSYTLTASNGTNTIEKKVTVSPAEISITGATVQDKTYDGNQDATVTGVEFTGLVNSESLSLGTDYTATATFADKNVGDSKSATVTVTLKNGNYTFAGDKNTTEITATAAIQEATLTVTAPSETIYVGEEIPDLSTLQASVAGLVGEDSFTGVTLAYENTPDSSAPRSWAIVPSGGSFTTGSADNYTIQYVNGTLTVEANFEKVVTGVTLDKTTLELYTGNTAILTATVQPSDATNKNVTWSSYNAEVATVEGGTVTAVGAGETTITVTTEDGNYTASCKVIVTKPEEPKPPIDQPSYYNIYVEDVCEGVDITTSKNVVREGGSISLYVEKDTANYTFDNFKVYYKRSYYGVWEVLEEGTQPGEYPINNIWTHIYIKAEGAEEKEDPTGIESIEGVKVYTKDGSLYVQTPQREQVLVISMSGAVVKNEEQVGLKQYHGLQPGIYIVRVGDRAYKLRLH